MGTCLNSGTRSGLGLSARRCGRTGDRRRLRIGAAIAAGLSAKGARIAVVDLNEAGAAEGGSGIARCAGSLATSPTGFVTAAVDAVIEELAGSTSWSNSAGIARLAPAEDLSLADWDSTIAIDLKGTFLMCQTVGRHMLAAGGGAIIDVASQAASVAIEEHVAYCASKFGVVGITKVLARNGRGVACASTASPPPSYSPT